MSPVPTSYCTTASWLFQPTLFKTTFSRNYFLPTCLKIGTPKFRRFIMDISSWKDPQKIQGIADVLHNTSVDIFEAKKRALEDGIEAVIQQTDQEKSIIGILMKANVTECV